MSKFKIGDRVKYVGLILGLKGKVGTVVSVTNYTSYSKWGVVFDEHLPFCHSLGGLCAYGYGRWCECAELELISEHRFNVIITSVGDTTTAKLLHGKNVEKEVSVKRYHRDDYSEEAAVEAVCKKLFGEDKPEKEPEPFGINCKAVYISTSECGYTRGKIYEFSDGRCLDDGGDLRPDLARDPIINTKSPWFADRFVKIVGERHE